MPHIDVHDFEKLLRWARRRIDWSDMAKENKRLLLNFEIACRSDGLRAATRVKLLRHLTNLGTEFLRKPFREVTRADLRKAVARIEERHGYAPNTKRDVKMATRKFFKYAGVTKGILTSRTKS